MLEAIRNGPGSRWPNGRRAAAVPVGSDGLAPRYRGATWAARERAPGGV